ncbi:MAG: hydrogenase formation protein HypD [bacterium]|nr:hydrogenase formation protein HypD [bacterium]
MNLQTPFDTILQSIHSLSTQKRNIMEVCGTHTVSISRSGLRSQLPSNLRLLSGPGCPVCVTPVSVVDAAISLSQQPNVVVFTFGDMLRVPGTQSTLQREMSRGAKVKIVYSPLESIIYAKTHPKQQIVFIGVGFETTLPILAATIQRAKFENLLNFSMLVAGKLVPPAMAALMEDPNVQIDGFICPGHVSTIIGAQSYEFLVKQYSIPCVITGFLPTDIAEGILLLLKQLSSNRSQVEIQYTRAVSWSGNISALQLMDEVFEPVDSEWRGIGLIPRSGVQFKEEYIGYDAIRRFQISLERNAEMPKGCSCGDVMKGILLPFECPIFGNLCTPTHPVGPCMVSSEGACAAYYHYETVDRS